MSYVLYRSYFFKRHCVLQSELFSSFCCLHMHQEGELAWAYVACHLATIFVEHHVDALRAVQSEGDRDLFLIRDAEGECVSLLIVPQPEVIHHWLFLHTLSVSSDHFAIDSVFDVFKRRIWVVGLLTILDHELDFSRTVHSHHEHATGRWVEIFIVAPVFEETHDFLGAILFPGPIFEPVDESSQGQFFLAVMAVIWEYREIEVVLTDGFTDTFFKQGAELFMIKRVVNLNLI